MLDNNPVREIFFKEIKLDGPLGKIKYYAIRTEFKERDSPHVHSFISIFNAPNCLHSVF